MLLASVPLPENSKIIFRQGNRGQKKAAILALHPTQLTVGEKEVAAKAEELSAKTYATLDAHLLSHIVPVVVGPHDVWNMIDHHHFVLAAYRLGITHVYSSVVADWHDLHRNEFWARMQQENFVYPLDEHGVRHTIDMLPTGISGLRDDIYRSLAWAARKAGAYEKTTEPFSEFRWSAFYRQRIAIETLQQDFNLAIELAVSFSHHHSASHMPGYTHKE